MRDDRTIYHLLAHDGGAAVIAEDPDENWRPLTLYPLPRRADIALAVLLDFLGREGNAIAVRQFRAVGEELIGKTSRPGSRGAPLLYKSIEGGVIRYFLVGKGELPPPPPAATTSNADLPGAAPEEKS